MSWNYKYGDNSTIIEMIKEEVSRAADDAYSDNGTPLYDAIVLTSKDESEIERLVEDGVNAILNRFYDIASIPETSGAVSQVRNITFDNADSQANAVGDGSPAERALNQFLCYNACAIYFKQKRAALVQEYEQRAKSALDRAAVLLRMRTALS